MTRFVTLCLPVSAVASVAVVRVSMLCVDCSLECCVSPECYVVELAEVTCLPLTDCPEASGGDVAVARVLLVCAHSTMACGLRIGSE